MKLKSKYKSFVSSLKKVIFKLKEKAVLCTKQSKPTTQTYSEFTDISIQETQINTTTSINYTSLILTINKNIQKNKRVIAKWLYPTSGILLTPVFNPIPKHNIQTYFIYHRRRLFV